MTPIKSKIVFAPAGSGKTEQLSNRFLELIEAGVRPERILTLTFTDKAAAEMKERILINAKKRNPEIYRILRENILRLRISTIHSFCFSLVRRFADLLNIDPNPEALTADNNLWQQAKYDALMKIAEDNDLSDYRSLLIRLITREHTQGWKNFSDFLDHLFKKRTIALRTRPAEIDINEIDQLARWLKKDSCGLKKIEKYQDLFPKDWSNPAVIQRIHKHLTYCQSVFMTTQNTPKIRGFSEEERTWARAMVSYRNLITTLNDFNIFQRRWQLFKECFLATYNKLKKDLGMVDYDDMELLALKLLTEEPEWQNILYIFDEHTDHILVDEFQDTSFLQWSIIDKLTEEWRSGEGIKSELNINPTIFIVGDDKQSIYMFRDARVELFFKAKEKLEQWLGSKMVKTVALEANYRSLPAIIDFTNALFSQLMPTKENSEPWRTCYRHFTCQRTSSKSGKVELILALSEDKLSSSERRETDAQNITRHIKALIAANYEVLEHQDNGSETARPCKYSDIAILIRARQGLLPALENCLRRENIPFVVVGGTGFYEETEIKYLTALTSFLADPGDDTALYITLRGPMFNIAERELFFAIVKGTKPQFSANAGGSAITLWERLLAREQVKNSQPLFALGRALKILADGLKRVNYEPLYSIIDRILIATKAWQIFSKPQQVANIKKFLQIIQEQELAGSHPLEIKNFLEEPGEDEPKADVSTEAMNAVQIMTVHSAKGLQFPIVYHPGLHEKILSPNASKERLVVAENDAGEAIFSYIEESSVRKKNPLHTQYLEKQIEEEKRVFYVACTRARDALFLTGIWDKATLKGTKLEWLIAHLGLKREKTGFELGVNIPGLSCITAKEIPEVVPSRPQEKKQEALIRKELITTNLPSPIRAVTRFSPDELRKHSDETIGMGEVLHRLLELIARGNLDPFSPQLERETIRLLWINHTPAEKIQSLTADIKKHISRLTSSPVWEIVKPQPDSFSELPIMFNDGKTIWTGRIDRVILQPDAVHIYDYKTFTVKKEEIPKLKEEYCSNQLVYYVRACAEIFPNRAVKAFLVFTALPAIEQVEVENL